MQKFTIFLLLFSILIISCEKNPAINSHGSINSEMEIQVEEYIQKFPYQDTYNYAQRYTGGDLTKYNIWVLGAEPSLVKAGEDKVVRMNNDTFYKMAFVVLDNGPVYLESSSPSKERFSSFQLMDDRNVNYHNIINPDGKYTLYKGDMPAEIQGKAVEVPSNLSVIIVRVEVKDKNNPEDVAAAEKVFNGITINGPGAEKLDEVNLMGKYDEKIKEEANKRLMIPFLKCLLEKQL